MFSSPSPSCRAASVPPASVLSTSSRARHGREVERAEHEVVLVLALAERGERAVLPVVEVHPLESLPREVDLVQAAESAQHGVEVAHETLDAAVGVEVEEVPVEPLVAVPLVPLPMKASFLPGWACM